MGSFLLRAALTGVGAVGGHSRRSRHQLRRRGHHAGEGRHHLRRRGDLRSGQRDHQTDRADHFAPAVHPHARPDPHRDQCVDVVDHRRGSPITPRTGASTSSDFWWTAIWAAIVLSIVSWLLRWSRRRRRTPRADIDRHTGVMPELPEIEALADHLRRHAVGLTVGRIDVVGALGAQDVRSADQRAARSDRHRRQPVGQVPRHAGRAICT